MWCPGTPSPSRSSSSRGGSSGSGGSTSSDKAYQILPVQNGGLPHENEIIINFGTAKTTNIRNPVPSKVFEFDRNGRGICDLLKDCRITPNGIDLKESNMESPVPSTSRTNLFTDRIKSENIEYQRGTFTKNLFTPQSEGLNDGSYLFKGLDELREGIWKNEGMSDQKGSTLNNPVPSTSRMNLFPDKNISSAMEYQSDTFKENLFPPKSKEINDGSYLFVGFDELREKIWKNGGMSDQKCSTLNNPVPSTSRINFFPDKNKSGGMEYQSRTFAESLLPPKSEEINDGSYLFEGLDEIREEIWKNERLSKQKNPTPSKPAPTTFKINLFPDKNKSSTIDFEETWRNKAGTSRGGSSQGNPFSVSLNQNQRTSATKSFASPSDASKMHINSGDLLSGWKEPSNIYNNPHPSTSSAMSFSTGNTFDSSDNIRNQKFLYPEDDRYICKRRLTGEPIKCFKYVQDADGKYTLVEFPIEVLKEKENDGPTHIYFQRRRRARANIPPYRIKVPTQHDEPIKPNLRNIKTILTLKKDEKSFMKHCIIRTDDEKSKFTKAPEFSEKSIVLPQMLARLAARQEALVKSGWSRRPIQCTGSSMA